MDTFYTDHWQTIEPERLDRYEQLFRFRPEQEPFVEALALSGKTSVLDFGCGPGFMAEEIASRTTAQVFGVDLNKEFVSRAQSRNTKKNRNFFIWRMMPYLMRLMLLIVCSLKMCLSTFLILKELLPGFMAL
jgi:SAM-dependent methyltransferase